MAGFIRVLIDQCLGCGICSDVCPSGALEQEVEMPVPEYFPHLCTNCLKCFEQCPFGAIEIKAEIGASKEPQNI